MRERLAQNSAFPVDQYPSERIAALGAVSVNRLHGCVASRLTQNYSEVAVTAGAIPG